MYELPASVNVCGTDYDIETDFRAILDIFGVLEDPDLTGNEKGVGMLGIFYKRFFDMPAEHFGEAVQKCYWFINGGNDKVCKNATKLMDWEKDFPILIAPVTALPGQKSAQCHICTGGHFFHITWKSGIASLHRSCGYGI